MSEAPYPPAEPPADGDWTGQVPPAQVPTPRYSASASVPVPPSVPQLATPPSPYPGQGGPYGQGGQQLGQPPAQTGQPSATGQTRVAAKASVPANASVPTPGPTTYGTAPQGYPAQAGVYGQPTGANLPGSPPGGQYGQPQRDPGPGAGQYGQAQGGGQFGASPGYGTPAPPAMGSPMGQGTYSSPTYGQPGPDVGRPRENQGGAPDGWQYAAESAPQRRSRRGLVITLIVVAVLVVVGVGGYVGWSLTSRGSAFTVGACVQPDGGDAVVVDCATSGAFRITSIVEKENTCPDANQPSLLLTERVGGSRKYACLVPAS